MQNLYRQVIMDHYKNPRNKGLKGYKQVHLRNPSCGDDVYVEADIQNGVIRDVCHEGQGCSICCSSASVMSELLKGKDTNTAHKIIQTYFKMIKGEEIQDEEILEEALVYQGISQYPARMKCAAISWQAMEEILGDEKGE